VSGTVLATDAATHLFRAIRVAPPAVQASGDILDV